MQGQKQRVAIVRDPKILLLDEASRAGAYALLVTLHTASSAVVVRITRSRLAAAAVAIAWQAA